VYLQNVNSIKALYTEHGENRLEVFSEKNMLMLGLVKTSKKVLLVDFNLTKIAFFLNMDIFKCIRQYSNTKYYKKFPNYTGHHGLCTNAIQQYMNQRHDLDHTSS
jgi:hypothetical protein